ncbi:hypothetical protein, partial [Escherichia coli]|uniref:hypothetical protein n=1 Tax=Escherichia coli TaxID=562 RepID=UPI0022AC8B46
QEANTWLAQHHGVIPVATLLAFGASRRTIYRHAERLRWVPILPGVLLSSHWPIGRLQLMAAACARNDGAAIAFTTAATEWAARRLPPDDAVHVLVPHGRSPQMDGIVVHRCRRIDPVDVVVRPDGIRLTSPPRTLFDCADILGVDAASS